MTDILLAAYLSRSGRDGIDMASSGKNSQAPRKLIRIDFLGFRRLKVNRQRIGQQIKASWATISISSLSEPVLCKPENDDISLAG